MNIKHLTLIAVLGICLSLTACGGKDAKGGDKAQDTSAKSDDKAKKKSAKKVVDNPKYQASAKALGPSFPVIKLPFKMGEGYSEDYADGDISADVLVKHLGYDKKAAEKSGYGIMGIAPNGRFEGPDGDTRFLITHYNPVNSQALLFAFDPESEQWVATEVCYYKNEDPEALAYKACVIKADGTVEIEEWKTKLTSPGDFDSKVIDGKKKKTVLSFLDGQWQE